MAVYIALLRAVNVGGTGKLPMTELKAMCENAGFSDVKTYIASGNVVFKTSDTKAKIKKALESQLEDYAGKPVGVLLRSIKEMQTVLDNNPHPKLEPSKTTALFLDGKPTAKDIDNVTGLKNEQLTLGSKEIYTYYPDGMGLTKLKIPAAKTGTARNMNTIAKLLIMAKNAQGAKS